MKEKKKPRGVPFIKGNPGSGCGGRPPKPPIYRNIEKIEKLYPDDFYFTKEDAISAKAELWRLAKAGNDTALKIIADKAIKVHGPEKTYFTISRSKLKTLNDISEATGNAVNQMEEGLLAAEDASKLVDKYELLFKMRRDEKIDLLESKAADSDERIKKLAQAHG